jgi:hypothetical protein
MRPGDWPAQHIAWHVVMGDGEFAPGSQTYDGSETLRYA